MADPEEPLDPEFIARDRAIREALEERDASLKAFVPRDGLAFWTALKAYIDASKRFTEASVARFAVLSDLTRARGDADEIGPRHGNAALELRRCFERVNVILDELEPRPGEEEGEREEQRKLMADAEAEARGEWIDTEPDAAAVHDASPEDRAPRKSNE